MHTSSVARLDDRSRYLRELTIEALEGGARGHVGSTLSLIEILRVLYDDILSYDAVNPAWEQRDRFILSKGHGCLALYAILADKNFFSRSELARQCTAGALLGGHPEASMPGVEVATGALGHGLSIGVGMALAARMKAETYRVFVVMGDGELDEGAVWEAALSAGKHGLDNLVAIVDYNKLQSYGPTSEVMDLEPLAAKWRAFNFAVREVDGHDVAALKTTLRGAPFEPGRPNLIVAHTIKGRGVDVAEGNPSWHHKAKFSSDDAAEMRSAIARQPHA